MINDCFYYGVYTPEGYYTLKAKPDGESIREFSVAGHSHAVKQKLFENIISYLEANNMDFIKLCSAEGYDGIYSKDADFLIRSGNEGSGETIHISDFQDTAYTVGKADEILAILDRQRSALKRAQRFLAAAQSITDDAARLESEYIDLAKVSRYSLKLWQRTGGKMNGKVGTQTKRFVSCITEDGVELNMDAFDIYCDKITVIQDRTGACARLIADRIRSYALSAGYDVISCPCPINVHMGAEHLIIPELRYGLFVSKHYHRADFNNSRRVFAKRFISQSSEQIKHRMDFSLKAYRKMMDEAFDSIEEKQMCDKALDCIFYGATDIDRLTKETVKILFN